MSRQQLAAAAALGGVVLLADTLLPRPSPELAGYGLGVAALATAALLLVALRSPSASRLRDAGLIALATVSVWLWLAPWGLSPARQLHVWDFFHYYVGSKYFRELGHDGLYDCTLVADAQARRPGLAATWLRDLRTNQLVPATDVLSRPRDCTERFTPERWASFRRDVAWFRIRMPANRWNQMRTDHGYNPPPVWGILGTTISNLAPATQTSIAALMLLDPLLLMLMFGAIGHAFGWRCMALCIVFWTSYRPSDWQWVGGSFLRHGWLVASVLGICLLKKGRTGAGGAALAYAAWLRLFPALLFLGPFFEMLGACWRDRALRVGAAERRLVGYAAAASVLLAVLATPIAGGVGAWQGFLENTRLHAATPLDNHMGLRAALSFDRELRSEMTRDPSLRDPWEPWRQARAATFASREVVYWALAAAMLALLIVAVQRQPMWVSATLAIGAPAIAVDLTCYYYAIFLALCFAWTRWPVTGVVMLGLAAASRALPPLLAGRDEIFFVTTLLSLGAWGFVCAVVFRHPDGH